MKRITFILTLVAAAFLAAPIASAQSIQSTVWLHDLVENGAYTGCHVTTGSFTTYRLTVQEGSTIDLTVRSYENNTNLHTLNVNDQQVQVAPGATQTLQVQAGSAGSIPVLCDGKQDSLSGTILVRPGSGSASESDGGNSVPAPSLALVAVALGLAGRFARRS